MLAMQQLFIVSSIFQAISLDLHGQFLCQRDTLCFHPQLALRQEQPEYHRLLPLSHDHRRERRNVCGATTRQVH